MSLDLDPRHRAMLAEMGVALPEWPAEALPAEHAPAAAAVTTARTRTAPAPESVATQPGGAPASGRFDAKTPLSAPTTARPVAAPLTPLGERPTGVETMDWDALEGAVAGCQACGLCRTRRNTVFGVGHRQAEWMIVGEAPGENEDLQGEPFVGQAGKLLDAMLRAVGTSRSAGAYICNVLKCRPPGNRNPEPAEVAQCEPFLRRQVELVQPKVILAMGRFAVQSLLQSAEPIGKLRGAVHQYNGVPLIVTYHPAYLLRNLPDKAKAWADLVLAMQQVKA